MMNIHITHIKIMEISNLGSLNIGKAILCHNRAISSAVGDPAGAPVSPAQVVPPAAPASLVTPVVPVTPAASTTPATPAAPAAPVTPVTPTR